MARSIEYSPYTLQAKRSLNRFQSKEVSGVLLKVHFDNIGIGYSALQTWPELGDSDLNTELKALASSKPLTLGKIALAFALSDATARSKNHSLYKNLSIDNHYSMGTPEKVNIPDGFKTIKVKLDKNFQKTLKDNLWLRGYKVRIDFNLALKEKDLSDLQACLASFQVDMIEDLGFHTDTFLLFLDQHKTSVCNAIIKPAKEGFDSNYHRILFTSYMDHPINQTHAAVVANDYYLKHPHKKEICGLRSDLAFFGNPYLEYFNTSNNSFTLSEDGHGIGFTSLLEREKWKTLIG